MEAEREFTYLLTPAVMLSTPEPRRLFISCIGPSPSPPFPLLFPFLLFSPHIHSPLHFSSLSLSWLSPQIATEVKLVTLSYHIQFRFLQNLHQRLNLGLFVEEKVIVHPENIFGRDLRYSQVPTSKPTL